MAYPSIVRGVPYVPPPPPIPDWRGYTHTWIDHTGRRWPLSDMNSGTVLMPGVEGMDDPEVALHLSEHAGVAGARFRGARTMSRVVSWSVFVWADRDSAEWLARAREFRAAFRADRTGVWEVIAPDGQTRYLTCRRNSPVHTYDLDPALAGYAEYGIELLAEDPYWRGAPITRSWQGDEDIPLVPADETDPMIDLQFGSSAMFAGATIPNPGDVAAWPRWRLVGPLEDITLRVGDGVLGCPDLTAGQVLAMDTNRSSASYRLDGGQARALVRPRDPRPVPPGELVPVGIEIGAGTGTVDLEIVPRYERGI